MKYISKITLVGILTAMIFASSCVDDTMLTYDVQMPASLEDVEYLKAYDALKTYIDRTANPNFKLGAGTVLTDYTGIGVRYRLLTANFDQITLANEMKHESVVQANGSMSFGNLGSLLETAKEADISVFGHTLVWHAQQRASYLNGLLADVFIPGTTEYIEQVTNGDMEGNDLSTSFFFTSNANEEFISPGAGGAGRALKIASETRQDNDWGVQFWVLFDTPAKEGEKYKFSMKVRSDKNCSFSTQAHYRPQDYIHWDFIGSISATPEWQTIEKELIISSSHVGDRGEVGAIAFNIGQIETTVYIDDVSLKKEQSSTIVVRSENLVTNGDMENDNLSTSFQFTANANQQLVSGGNPGRAMKIVSEERLAQSYSMQFWVLFGTPAKEGEVYEFSMDVRSEKNCNIGTQAHRTPGNYNGGMFGNIPSTPEWTTFKRKFTVTSGMVGTTAPIQLGAIAFDLGQIETTVYIDNVSLVKETTEISGEWIILTPEEKAEVVSGEMERWIKGIMEVTGGDVKEWDVVNEPMSDWPDPYQLKTGIGRTLPANEFYWQDYLGKDYAVKAIQFARQYGGSDLKLFINDYGLEGGDLDKCKGLIAYVDYVDGRGVKVDGIGTQMHIDLDTPRDNIVEMFKLLAATGKLIKITELDMGLGNGVTTPNATKEQYLAQADLYRFVVEKYFEHIPAAQRAGITIWSPYDSPDTSGAWRRNEPIGLWTQGLLRKHAYAGFANGLAGREIAKPD